MSLDLLASLGSASTSMSLLFHRKVYEESGLFPFTKEELDLAEKNQDGFIGIYNGSNCYLVRFLDDNDWALVYTKRK